jgi:uncharacterized membrane protein YdjX (TVP38/TMEM64 family)
LLPAIALPFALAVVIGVYGVSSNPFILLFIVGLPGTIIGVWAGSAFGENNLPFYILFYVVTVLANWTFYYCAVKGVISLKGKLRERGLTRISK